MKTTGENEMETTTEIAKLTIDDIEFERDAYANNYGTDGEVRYHQRGKIRSTDQSVLVTWETTTETDENNARY